MKAYSLYEKRENFIYVCNDSESVEEVAAEVGVPAAVLRKTNKVSGGLKAGDELLVVRSDSCVYRVAAGDTADEIAETFNVSVKELMEFNGVEGIYPGLVLYIPSERKI